jgi:hypothetical protein
MFIGSEVISDTPRSGGAKCSRVGLVVHEALRSAGALFL